jgi:hypothetical protein
LNLQSVEGPVSETEIEEWESEVEGLKELIRGTTGRLDAMRLLHDLVENQLQDKLASFEADMKYEI